GRDDRQLMKAVGKAAGVERAAQDPIGSEGRGDRNPVELNHRRIEGARLHERQSERNRAGDGAPGFWSRRPESGGHGVDSGPGVPLSSAIARRCAATALATSPEVVAATWLQINAASPPTCGAAAEVPLK